MKAIVYTEYGAPDVLASYPTSKSRTPKENEILIKIHAATVTAGDVNMRGFTFCRLDFGFLPRLMFGLRKPNRFRDRMLPERIEAVGSAVTQFKPGDQVISSGMPIHLSG